MYHAHMHTHTHTRTRTRTCTRTRTRTHTHTHTHTHTCTCTHICSCTHAYIHMHTYMYTRMHTHNYGNCVFRQMKKAGMQQHFSVSFGTECWSEQSTLPTQHYMYIHIGGIGFLSGISKLQNGLQNIQCYQTLDKILLGVNFVAELSLQYMYSSLSPDKIWTEQSNVSG